MSKVRTKTPEGKGKPPDPAPEPQTPQQPPPTKPKRTASLWDAGTPADPRWVLTISVPDHLGVLGDRHYHVRREPSEWGAHVRLTKLPADGGESYLVVLDDDSTCSCKSFEFRRACKHVGALTALLRAGKLDAMLRGGAA